MMSGALWMSSVGMRWRGKTKLNGPTTALNKALHPTAYSSVRRSSSLRFRRRVSLSFACLRAAWSQLHFGFALVLCTKFACRSSLVLCKYLQTVSLVRAALFHRLLLFSAFARFGSTPACKYLWASLVVSCLFSSWQLFACGAQTTFVHCQCGVGCFRAFHRRFRAAST